SRKVKGIVSKHLSLGELDAEVVAEQLHMSRHTLYRKLKQEGQSCQGLVEEVRKEKAIRYLNEDRYALSEIAFLLGFSELSALAGPLNAGPASHRPATGKTVRPKKLKAVTGCRSGGRAGAGRRTAWQSGRRVEPDADG